MNPSSAIQKRSLGLAPAVEDHFWDWLQALDDTLIEERTALGDALDFVTGNAFQVTDNDGMTMAETIVKQARDRFKELEEGRKQFTTPLLGAKGLVDEVYKLSTSRLEETIKAAKAKIAKFSVAQEQARRDMMARSAAQYQAGGTPTEMIPEPPAAKSTTVKRIWKVKIVDAALVPREHCSPDLQKLQAAIWYADTDTAPRPIPGVEFYQEERVTVR